MFFYHPRGSDSLRRWDYESQIAFLNLSGKSTHTTSPASILEAAG